MCVCVCAPVLAWIGRPVSMPCVGIYVHFGMWDNMNCMTVLVGMCAFVHGCMHACRYTPSDT